MLNRFCSTCNKKFTPTGTYHVMCFPCAKILHIKSMFKRYGKFKGCKTLKEALSKYGK